MSLHPNIRVVNMSIMLFTILHGLLQLVLIPLETLYSFNISIMLFNILHVLLQLVLIPLEILYSFLFFE